MHMFQKGNMRKKDKIMRLSELKEQGVKKVILNGWFESLDYVMGLSDVVWVDEVKSPDGYTMVQCYEQK